MVNPLLTPAEQAHIDAVRAQWAGQREDSHPAPRQQPENALQAILARLARIDWMNLYKHLTNALALGFVGFYMLDFSTIAANGNHIYTVYRLFPVLAALGICLAMWTLPVETCNRNTSGQQ